MNFDRKDDEEVEQSIEELKRVLGAEEEQKESLEETISELGDLAEELEEMEGQRDDYRDYLLEISDKIGKYLQEDTEVLGRMEQRLEEIKRQIDNKLYEPEKEPGTPPGGQEPEDYLIDVNAPGGWFGKIGGFLIGEKDLRGPYHEENEE